jgi:HprK-related kinase A
LKLRELEFADLSRLVSNEGLVVQIGCFDFLIKSKLDSIAESLVILYGDYEIQNNEFADFHVSVELVEGVRHYFFKQAIFLFEKFAPFESLPYQHAPALIEWGMNWCVSSQINTYLIIHAAVIEKAGYAVIMPAPSGSGKSTLTAALIQEGWRLLSDELTLIDLETKNVIPFPRPVSLKNQSIVVIKQRYPDVVFGILSRDTIKGSVCHFKPSTESILQQHQSCPVGWIVFPKYEANAKTELSPKGKAQTLLDVADNSFNYSRLGKNGFSVLAEVVDSAECYQFRYSDLDEAIAEFNALCAKKL